MTDHLIHHLDHHVLVNHDNVYILHDYHHHWWAVLQSIHLLLISDHQVDISLLSASAIVHLMHLDILRSAFLRTRQNSSFDEWNSAIPFVSALIGCIRTHYAQQNEDEITICHDRAEVSVPIAFRRNSLHLKFSVFRITLDRTTSLTIVVLSQRCANNKLQFSNV